MAVHRAVGMTGPLTPFREGFTRALELEGYAPESVELHLRLLAHLSRWLEERGWGTSELSDKVVEEFFAARRSRYVLLRTPRSLAPLVRYLGSQGVLLGEPAEPLAGSGVDELVESYRRHLVGERGLAAGSVELYVVQVRRLAWRWWPSGDVALDDLDGARIAGTVRAEATRLSGPSTKTLVCALRSFLRFLHVRGMTQRHLADAVPSCADRRRASFPRAITTEAIAQLVASCDPATAVGRRDAAILTVLARLGLRAGEVSALCLEDLDWRAGELVITGKGRRIERLPLPADVGEAIAAYVVDGRPTHRGRRLFLSVYAPHAPLSRTGITSVVHHACDRAGLARVGPHRFRHTAGTETLRAGAPLSEVAQLLRHRRMETTAIYAKVDRACLARLAQPWPGAAR